MKAKVDGETYRLVPMLVGDSDFASYEAGGACIGCAFHDPEDPITTTPACKEAQQIKGPSGYHVCLDLDAVFIRDTAEALAEYTAQRLQA